MPKMMTAVFVEPGRIVLESRQRRIAKASARWYAATIKSVTKKVAP